MTAAERYRGLLLLAHCRGLHILADDGNVDKLLTAALTRWDAHQPVVLRAEDEDELAVRQHFETEELK